MNLDLHQEGIDSSGFVFLDTDATYLQDNKDKF